MKHYLTKFPNDPPTLKSMFDLIRANYWEAYWAGYREALEAGETSEPEKEPEQS